MNMNSAVVMSNPEAFCEQYEEEKAILGQMTEEQSVIMEAWNALSREEALPPKERRFARIARSYKDRLRAIFNSGIYKEEARGVLAELYSASTVPFNDLEGEYSVDEGMYKETEPAFVMEELKNIAEVKAHDLEWENDFAEVQCELDQIEGEYKQPVFDKVLFEIAHRVIDFNDPNPVKQMKGIGKLSPLEDLSNESSGAYSQTEDDPEYFDDRGITATAINQEHELELHLDSENGAQMLQCWRKFRRGIQLSRTWAEAKLDRLGIDKTISNIVNEMEYCLPSRIDISWLSQKAMMFRSWIELGDDALFLTWINHEAAKWPRPDVLVFAIGQGWEDRLDQISLPSWKNLKEFYEVFGEEVLEEVLNFGDYNKAKEEMFFGEPVPARMSWCGDEEVDQGILDTWDDKIVDEKFIDNPSAKDADERAMTKAYARGLFSAIGTGVENLDEAGDEAWRRETSAAGNIAYHQTLKSTGNFQKAWRAFWNAGHITSIHKYGVTVWAVAAHKELYCDWGLTKWKLNQGEIVISKADKIKLKTILLERGWGKQLVGAL